MLVPTLSLFLTSFLVTVSALPISPRLLGITAAQLVKIAPSTAVCNAAGSFTNECRTADQAAPLIQNSFVQRNIQTVGEQAALLSLMLFETGNFQFDTNHFPGRPGQGTRNLMTFPFIREYALFTASTRDKAIRLSGTDANSPAITDDVRNAVRALVLSDDLSFASAAWFYTQSGPSQTGCLANKSLVAGLQLATRAGWEMYITDCVGTTVTEERAAVWAATLNVLLASL